MPRKPRTPGPALVKEAQRAGHILIKGTRITYRCRREHEDDYTDPEEHVRAAIFAWLIIDRGYPASQIDLEVPVPRRTPEDKADLVVFEDAGCRKPYLVVECKRQGLGDKDHKQAVEQAIGNANSFRVTQLALFDSMDHSRLYAIQEHPPDERERNHLGTRDALPSEFGRPPSFRLVAGGDRDIAPVSTRELENRVRRAHATIWAGGKRDPMRAFDEWCKLLFAKIHDERYTPNEDPRQFQVGTRDDAATVGQRVRDLYAAARTKDPSIFTKAIDLPDDTVMDVVQCIEDVAFTLTDLDTLGAAFESFFGSIFRGELGQYFTRRELARFTCAMLKPGETDAVLDPTAGSGGFLLESLIQVWRHIDAEYADRPDRERLKLEFAGKQLFGIEIHDVLGRVCQTNLLLHKDGHSNIEVDTTCLAPTFRNPAIRPGAFTVVVGNPPFGDEVKAGDRDKLGGSKLSDFDVEDAASVDSEIIILVRAVQFLSPGGRLGMVIPDGVLNNYGEPTRCPWLRRYLLKHGRILAIVSLPDHAFRKAGAQNKTSIIFWQKFTTEEREAFSAALEDARQPEDAEAAENDVAVEERALTRALQKQPYRVFLAEAERIGYSPTGATVPENDLYSAGPGRFPMPETTTILGQYSMFQDNPGGYPGCEHPRCVGVPVTDLFAAHPSRRLDPKYHIFRREMHRTAPAGMGRHRIGDLLERRRDVVVPTQQPDFEFQTLTLTQEGGIEPREAGKGNNPVAWFGSYFQPGAKWFRVHGGDLVFSRIDIWKGCIALLPPEFDGAIVTQEFPVYRVRETWRDRLEPYYLKLLLRTPYFQRAIRAITTGHSNRRRTQDEDFEDLAVFLPPIDDQRQLVAWVRGYEGRLREAAGAHAEALRRAEDVMMGADPLARIIHVPLL